MTLVILLKTRIFQSEEREREEGDRDSGGETSLPDGLQIDND